jgi:hypothetical protein
MQQYQYGIGIGGIGIGIFIGNFLRKMKLNFVIKKRLFFESNDIL